MEVGSLVEPSNARMATLCQRKTQRTVLIEPELIVGRSPNSGLRIPEAYVSAQHAALRWGGARWEVKDLASRNGTFLNGSRLDVGKAYVLTRGAELAFGSEGETWILVDDAAPRAMAIPMDGGEPLALDTEVLGLPSSDSPEASIFRDADGLWKLETQEGERTVLEHHRVFQVAGRAFRFANPDILGPTSTSLPPNSETGVSLRFLVSRDEEHVEIRAEHGGQVVDLGARSHNYLLLLLARARRDDEGSGFPDLSCGWLHIEDLLTALHITSTQLNIDVFRIRQQFSRVGLPGVGSVIERRPRQKQIRLGFASFAIEVM